MRLEGGIRKEDKNNRPNLIEVDNTLPLVTRSAIKLRSVHALVCTPHTHAATRDHHLKQVLVPTMVDTNSVLDVLVAFEDMSRGSAQKEAEYQLSRWETEPGFYYALQSVYLNAELPLNVRWIAVIGFKNGVEKYWRPSRANALSKEEKTQIRSRLFSLVDDKNSQLTIQNAQAIARVVRFDFPGEWPNLFEEISKNMEDSVFQKGNLVLVNNLLIILNQAVKSVALVRIGRARHAFQTKAPLILPVLIKMYLKFFHMWTASLELTIMEICYMCLKNIRRIIPEGFEQPHKNHDICDFMRVSVSHLQGLVSENEKYSSDLLEKYVKSYSKLYVNLIVSNPTSFVLIPCSREIVSTYMSLLQNRAEVIYNSSEENDFWEVLALKGFLILKKMVTYVYKQGAVTLKQRHDKDEVNNAILTLKSQFFTSEVVRQLCDLIINWYLRLKPTDLESWLLEPEEWTNEELNSSWEYQVRPCAENFFQDLVKYFKDDVSDFILNKISNGILANDSLDNILTKDSILCTFQLSADSIADKVNFDQLLEQVFIPEGLRDDRIENKIIKRRICLIISTWVSVDYSRQSRVEIYKLLATFLQPDKKINDKVIKLTTVQCLRFVINDWDFVKQDFHPYLTEFVSLFISLLQSVAYTESKLYILDTLAILIERCNPLIDEATLLTILRIVPHYWNKSINEGNEESILKTSLLRVLKSLVVALNKNSYHTYEITAPLIRSCCTVDSEWYYLLSEDGYELWLSILQYYPADSPLKQELIDCFGLIHQALLQSTEILTTILSIIRSYSLLSPELFDTQYGLEIFRVLSGYLATMRDDSFDVFVSLADILFLLKSYDEKFIEILIESGLMNAMIAYVLDENNGAVLANKILVVLSRLAYSAPAILMRVLEHLSIDTEKLLTTWMSYFKSNGNPRNKKVNLMALLKFSIEGLRKNVPMLTKVFGEVLRQSFLFLEEVQEDAVGKCQAYEGDYVYSDIDNYAYLDPDIAPHGEKIRYQKLLETKDPVYSVNLKAMIREDVIELKQSGGDGWFEGVRSVLDQYTSEKLHELIL